MNPKILVVDDEPDLELLIRQKFRKKIQEKEYSFVFAQNGLDALRTVEQDGGIEVVMTDINMPQMDGLTLLGKLQEIIRDRTIEAIVVSAYGDMQNIRTAMNKGAFDFVTKPIDFQDLELTLNKTLQRVASIRDGVEARAKLDSVQKELEVARQIQQSIIPQKFPPFPGRTEFDLYAYMIPAKEVGGDFYDFFLIDNDHLGFVIGDVSGKGVPSAIFMAMCRGLLRSVAISGCSPGDCLTTVNRSLSAENESGMFVTVFYGILDTRTGEMAYANGGHNHPYIVHSDHSAVQVPSTEGLVVGVLGQFSYATHSLTLAPGELIFLYTDGVTEAMDAQDDMYSDERLEQFLAKQTELTPKTILHAVVDDVRVFVDGHAQSDDITNLVVRYMGTAS